MTTERAEPTPPAGPGRDWADQAADALEHAVGVVRDKAVVPAQRATSAIVFGLLATCFAVPAAFLLLIGLFRAVDNYLPGEAWSAWLLLGGIFLVSGGFLWSRRRPRAA
jgi:LPXTG-motif cell wall-anchored protein